jgi:hypothetical protein
MKLAAIAFAVCLMSAAILCLASRFVEKLRFSRLSLLSLPALAAFTAVLALRPRSFLLADVIILAAAVFAGSLLGSVLRGYSGAASFLVAAAIADVVSSVSGATARLSRAFRQGGSSLLRYLGIALPLEGRVVLIIGVADLMILATVYFVLRRLGKSGPWMFIAPLIGLLLAVVAGLVFGGVAAIPFIAAATLAYLWVVSGKRRGGSA